MSTMLMVHQYSSNTCGNESTVVQVNRNGSSLPGFYSGRFKEVDNCLLSNSACGSSLPRSIVKNHLTTLRDSVSLYFTVLH